MRFATLAEMLLAGYEDPRLVASYDPAVDGEEEEESDEEEYAGEDEGSASVLDATTV